MFLSSETSEGNHSRERKKYMERLAWEEHKGNSQGYCGGLNENGPHRLTYLHVWAIVGEMCH